MFSIFGRLCFNILFFFFLSRLFDYNTTYIYTKIKIPIHKAVQWCTKKGKQEVLKIQKTVCKESPFGILERLDDHAHYDATSHEKLGLLKRTKKLESSTKDHLGGLAGGLESSNLRGTFTGLREFFLFRLLEEERILLGPGGPRAGAATGTYSTRPSSTTSDILTSGLDAVSLRGVPA